MPNWKKIIVSGSNAELNIVQANEFSGSFSGSFQGDGSQLTGISGGGTPFPYTGSAQITGSLGVTGSVDILSGSISLIDDQENTIIGKNIFSTAKGTINQSVVIGLDAAKSDTSTGTNSEGNVIIGYKAAEQFRGEQSVFIGALSGYLQGSFSSKWNVAIGYSTLTNVNGGQANVALGYSAGQTVTSGRYNVFIGQYAKPLAGNDENTVVIHGGTNASHTGKGSNTTLIGNVNTTHTYLEGLITGSAFSGSFAGDGSGLTNLPGGGGVSNELAIAYAIALG